MKLGQNQSLRSLREGEMSQVSLRERKKARTRAAIREHAMRLFREQGFAETTVDQVADDPRIITAFRAQPPEISTIAALRAAFKQVFAEMTAEEVAQERQRHELILAVPELRIQMMDEYTRNLRMIADLVAERTGRSPDDQAVRVFAGALVGVGMAAMLTWTEDPSADFYSVIDSSMALVEAGLPL